MKAQTNRVVWPDGSTETVVTDMRDWVAYDMARANRRWPPFHEAAILQRSFLIWHAKKRRGDDVQPQFDPVRDSPASVEDVEDDPDPIPATP